MRFNNNILIFLVTMVMSSILVFAAGKITDPRTNMESMPIAGVTPSGTGKTVAVDTDGNFAFSSTSLEILDDWDESDRAKVNPIVGQAGVAAGVGAAGATTQRVTEGSTTMQARGTEDVAGADTYTTLKTPSANATHAFITLGGTNDAVISFDGGSTEGPVIPAGTAVIFDGLTITSGVAIQGKNKTAGQNYANLNVSIW